MSIQKLYIVSEKTLLNIGLNEIKKISKASGWNLVRWQTDEDNFTAKKLYDKVAKKTKKNVYELKS